MTVTVPTTRAGLNDRFTNDDLLDILRRAVIELQQGEVGDLANLPYKFKSVVVAGTTATANIAVAGIATEDHLISVVRFDVATDTGTSATGNKVQDVTGLVSEASITSAGNIQLSTTDTSGDKLLVVYYDVSATAP